MGRASLIVDLKAAMGDAVDKFTGADDADFQRLLDVAAANLARYRRRTLLGTITLEAERPDYPAPADLLQIKLPLWGRRERSRRKMWDLDWPGALPRLQLVDTADGREVHLVPAPTAMQISSLGSTYQYYYYATHRISDDAAQTTVQPVDRDLLLLRAAAEAMRELAVRGVVNPIQLHRGLGSMPASGTPQALYGQLLAAFEQEARR